MKKGFCLGVFLGFLSCQVQAHQNFQDALSETGVTPERLCAARLTVEQCEQALANLDAERQNLGILHARRAEVDTLVTEVAELDAIVRLTPWDEEAREAAGGARVRLDGLQNQIEALRHELAVATLAHLGDAQQVLAGRLVRSESILDEMELHIGLGDAAAERRARQALVIEQRAIRENLDVPDWAQALLEDLRADPEVQASRLHLRIHLTSVQIAFEMFQPA